MATTGGFLSGVSSDSMTSGISSYMGPATESISMGPLSETSETISLLEPKGLESTIQDNLQYSALVSYIESRYTRAKESRLFDESRWLEAYRNYRGIYGPEVQFTSTEKSRAFIKTTSMKVNAAYSQVTEVLFANNRFPIGVEATRDPLGIEKNVSYDPQSPDNQLQGQPQGAAPQAPSGPQVSATIARPAILQSLGPIAEKVEPIKDKLKPGVISTPSAIVYSPAEEAADLLEQVILDQLEEAEASTALRAFCFEFCLLGTGVFKGPILRDKEYPKWETDGSYAPISKTIPDVTNVSLWDAYPDPEARKASEMEYFIQRHRMSKTQLRQLKKRPFFRSNSVDIAISMGPNYQEEYWETYLKDDKQEASPSERYEVLEYWGLIDEDVEELADIEIPDQFKGMDEVQVNAWICNGQVLRLVYNPFTPVRIPYYIAPYQNNPYSIFGIGVGENMADMQLLMNGFARLLVDNAVISSNIVFEVNETNLVPGQDFEMYPGKVFKTSGAPGQNIFATKYPNVTQECILAFDKFRQLADEATGLPSYSHGMSGIMSTGRTASGMSMLMGAADKGIKSVIRNIDDYLLIPLGKSLYAFNMQFNFSEKYIGDLDIVAMGTDSLMRGELRSQKLLQFLQVTANPMDAPYTQRSYLLRELAKSMELDSDKAVVDQREAMINAEIMKNMAMAQGIDPSAMSGGAGGNAGGGPSPSDPTGNGGGIAAPGKAQPPGAAGFTGGGGGQNSPPKEKAE